MMPSCSTYRFAFAALLSVLLPLNVSSQKPSNGGEPAAKAATRVPARDTVVLTASNRYRAGSFHRLMLGDNYRDLWSTPIKVPVLDLRTFAGGLTALETGGGAQTTNLRLAGKDGLKYVFRPVYKDRLENLDRFEGTVVKDIFADGLSGSHPTAPVIAHPLLEAADLLHPKPVLVVMPDDPLLGEFREYFAHKLGTIEEYPSEGDDDVRRFGGAEEIIDSDELLERMNEDPRHQVDAHALLAARLLDFLMGDNDRHRDQWKWAKLNDGDDAPWVPIPRDRDKVMVSHEGLLLRLARVVRPNLVSFEGRYPPATALAGKVIEFDRRLLAGLDRADWDSVATHLMNVLTDSVIAAAIAATPDEYAPASRSLTAKLRARRDGLPGVAARYYSALAAIPEIHATDAADVARVTRNADGSVEISIASGSGEPWYQRRFVPPETREIRLFLHGGDDKATVAGQVPHSILVRVIGGNGTNTLVDSSIVGGRRDLTRLYDNGHVTGVTYGPDTAFNRRPWVDLGVQVVEPTRDRGSKMTPVFGLKTGRGLGIMPEIGIRQTRYGFDRAPYASMVELEVGYSTDLKGWAVELDTDNRLPHSPLHILSQTEWSQVAVGRFHGFGNDDVDTRERTFHDVQQTQWSFNPALGISLSQTSEFSIGPVVKYVSTDSLADRFISEARPYGFGRFGQAGVRTELVYDVRRNSADGGDKEGKDGEEEDDDETKRRSLLERFDGGGFTRSGYMLRLSGSAYPALWDAREPFGDIAAVATAYYSLPFLTKPVLAFRAGGEKVFGMFPYYEAAFLGGRRSLRTVRTQRYAGDASLYGSAEVRVPVADFAFILPLNVGLIGFMDAGRVYMDGESPGGWHTGAGGGFWLGVMSPATSISVSFTNHRDRRILLGTGFPF